MHKKNSKIAGFLGAVLLCFGCSESAPQPTPDAENGGVSNEPEAVISRHYILSFVRPASFEAITSKRTPLLIGIRIASRDSCYHYNHEQNPSKYPAESARYKQLCERYEDTYYHTKRTFYPFYSPGEQGYEYLMENLVSIGIVSNADYDAAHPAGSSLADLCRLIAYTPLPYIENGYDPVYDWSNVPDYLPDDWYTYYPELTPICKPLHTCTPEDFRLIGNGMENVAYLQFDKRPEGGQKQKFTITLTDERGTVFTATTLQCTW